MTGLVGALSEAWGEVRVHRSRVVLSLVGVVIAVFAMTIITAAGEIGRQIVLESVERSAGRSTTLSISANSTDGIAVSEQRTASLLTGLVDRYGVEHSSTVLSTGLSNGPSYTEVFLVEPDYGVIHRIDPVAGRWLVDGDGARLSPAVVVNEHLLEQVGMVGRPPPFAIPLGGSDQLVTVVGVVDRSPNSPVAYLLPAGKGLLGEQGEQGAQPSSPVLELWVPPELADQIVAEVPGVLAAQGFQGEAYVSSNPDLPGLISKAQWGVRVLSLFALALGALGVLNVGIVTVRQRIREIGVRRALGASSGRVFAAVVLESVCATAVAGAVGVVAAVALVVNLPLETLLRDADITDVPPFPVSAAIEAFLAAVAVGALAGLVPATIAVRSRVIDAIRY